MFRLFLAAKKWTFTHYLFAFTVLWTSIQSTLGLAEYFRTGWVIPRLMPFAYFVLLIAYVGRREFERWTRGTDGQRFLRVIFLFWWTLLLATFIGEGLYPKRFTHPGRILDSCLYVTGVVIFGDLSKRLHDRYRRGNHHEPRG